MGGQIQALGKVDGAAWRGPRLAPSLATALWLLLVWACSPEGWTLGGGAASHLA